MPRFDQEQVRRYYDRHTPGFVAFGHGAAVGAIHRAVWGPGVRDRRSAFRYVEDQIVELIRYLPPEANRHTVVDLGCGVGASLRYLAERLPIRGTGITVSPVQAQLATTLIRDAGLSDCVVCLEGDYCELPAGLGPVDLAYAIESFVHAPEPTRFLDQCRRLVGPGGMLAICDDFRGAPGGPKAERTIERFREGWHINSLLDVEELKVLARAAGFEHRSTLDLSPYLEIHRVRDRVVGALLSLLGWLPSVRTRFDHLVGGRALQTCLERGWVRYELTVFRRLG
jgi:SAM-dependent methyltransferase